MGWNRIIDIPWFVFGVVWLASSLFTRATVKRETVAARLSYAAPLILGCMLVFSRAFERMFPWLGARLVPSSNTLCAAGFALSVAGVAFAFWARATLGKLWSGNITLKEGHRLVQTGPYALARHPIYTGLSTTFVGTALTLGTVRAALGAAIAIGSFIYKFGREERWMAAQFAEEHARYCARVKRLVPFVW